MWFIVLLMGFSHASFVMEKDGLCFVNGTPELRRFGPLGWWGDKKGVCQGMSGIVSAFHENAIFNPHGPRLTSGQAVKLVDRFILQHSQGKMEKIEVPGHEDLQDFCREYRDLFMKKAISYNADIAVKEIAPLMSQYLSYKDAPLGQKGREQLHKNLLSFQAQLKKGRWPLMLYYGHVVAIFDISKNDKGLELALYDSNKLAAITYRVGYDRDGLPSIENKMLWDITPQRN